MRIMNLYKLIRSKGVILWDAAEADTIKMKIIMIITTAMKAGDSIYVI